MIKLNGFQPLQKNVNQIAILKIEILCNTLHTAEQFIKLVVGENHFQCQLLDTFRALKSSFIEFWPKFEKIRKITAF